MSRLTLVLLSLWSAGCYFGRSPSSYPPAQGPRGAAVTITTARQVTVAGELLAVTDTALVVHGPSGVMLVPFAATRDAWLPDLRMHVRNGQRPNAREAEKLRLHSRFPQGISAELLARLLERYDQPELVVVRP